ncbi:putative Glutathione S-transferase 1 [Seiridium cardinale]|uniref:Glutathione S-transferase 1 n=1 Tax=Seiridium cardinale TaxID=138064 RepID=A0ABR2XPJ1_9PEZI
MATEESPKIKLYWLEKSRAQSILWLLEELKIDYELELIHRNKETMLAPPKLKEIHPLGKSPVISITPPGSEKPIVIAETGFIAQYLSEHFGQNSTLVPKRWKDGQEGKVGGETEEWMRWMYLLHYTEGSLMSILMMALILGMLKGPKVPFFIRPITTMVVNQAFSSFVGPNIKTHLSFLEDQLATSGGDYLCGENLTSADIVVSFPLITYQTRFKDIGTWEDSPEKLYPKVWAYINRIDSHPGYKRSANKIKEIDDSFGVRW